MKLTVLALLGAAVLLGCSTTQTVENCTQQAEIYNTYIEALSAGDVLDEDDIKQARLAAAMLNATCGWVVVSQRSLEGVAPVDKNGVLHVMRPGTRTP